MVMKMNRTVITFSSSSSSSSEHSDSENPESSGSRASKKERSAPFGAINFKTWVQFVKENQGNKRTWSNPKTEFEGLQMCRASAEGSVGMVKTLVELMHVGVDTSDRCGRTGLHSAALHGQMDPVLYLLSKKAKVNAKDCNELTALHLAAWNNHVNVAKCLVDCGADLNAGASYRLTKYSDSPEMDYEIFDNNMTPLHLACEEGQTEACRFLLSQGAKINGKSRFERSPLFMASAEGHLQTVMALIEGGADVNMYTGMGVSSLYVATMKRHTAVVEVLADLVSDIDSMFEDVTPLMTASQHGPVEIVRCLVQHGANVNHKYKLSGSSPLMVASEFGIVEVVECLLANRANVNAVNYERVTALHLACVKGHTEVAKLLLDSGANIQPVNAQGRTPMNCACSKHHTDTVNLLVQRGIHSPGFDIQGALGAISFAGMTGVAKLLLDNGADVNGAFDGTVRALTPILAACLNNHHEMVDFLVKYGADVNTTHAFLSTPLHVAIGDGFVETVQNLITHGANINARGLHNFTPLHTACSAGHRAIVVLILEHRDVDLSLLDDFGRTALQVAVSIGYHDIARLLDEALKARN